MTDPHSGQPALKRVAVRIERFAAATYGFAVVQERPGRIDADYWAIARCAGGWRIELAFSDHARDWSAFAAALLLAMPGAEMLTCHDPAARRHRFARFEGGPSRLLLVFAKTVNLSADVVIGSGRGRPPGQRDGRLIPTGIRTNP